MHEVNERALAAVREGDRSTALDLLPESQEAWQEFINLAEEIEQRAKEITE